MMMMMPSSSSTSVALVRSSNRVFVSSLGLIVVIILLVISSLLLQSSLLVSYLPTPPSSTTTTLEEEQQQLTYHSNSKTTTSDSSNTTIQQPYPLLQQPSSPSASIRILCYGDSFTLGLSPPHHINKTTYCPYSDHLRRILEEDYGDKTQKIQIDHVGLSGYTTTQLLRQVQNSKLPGLLPALMANNVVGRRGKEEEGDHGAAAPAPTTTTIVVLLAGTNDIPRLLRNLFNKSKKKKPPSQAAAFDDNTTTTTEMQLLLQKGSNYLVRNLWTLQEIALSSSAQIHTITVGIPPSKQQLWDNKASTLVQLTNQQLKERILSHNNKDHNDNPTTRAANKTMTFVPFPFDYHDESSSSSSSSNNNNSTSSSTNNELLWALDGLHLSCKGYEVLATHAIAPTIISILNKQQTTSAAKTTNDTKEGGEGATTTTTKATKMIGMTHDEKHW